ncbi:enoyl-CoA hydratase/isomerase family protein [Roseospira marina]|uniref:Enoyl-CoA hydratase/isomerase family protein n=1 Tax=Roseospira marina TaxID=140057 RepID=A0A5M6IBH3_9PROT|nr:enoyl-CoA hydratase-related protein [Roseospira marina]KAA5605644.1 enoyl-CoA hydratase/isomerase family protein [Roseospira marina]MBB4313281.1 enoyl-CoA hydratase/carnithine racemase [Roseospira marina]MBB5085978.1 enoyl-CoA hydratase/carnithine racemase [Roseospira marina]
MSAHAILTSRSDSGLVATVTLNKPDKLNALDLPMWQGLAETFEALGEDAGLRTVVLQGAGKAFAAGADIGEFDTVRATARQAKEYDVVMRRALRAVRECPAPVVARIDGACVGGGLELAAQADLRVATTRSRFGVPISRISVVMAYPEIEGIQRLIGAARTAEILLEGKIHDAAWAYQAGLINYAVEPEALDETMTGVIDRIGQGAPLVARWHKRFIRRLVTPHPVSPSELDECYDFLSTADYVEGVNAFKSKRKPTFKAQ